MSSRRALSHSRLYAHLRGTRFPAMRGVMLLSKAGEKERYLDSHPFGIASESAVVNFYIRLFANDKIVGKMRNSQILI